MLTDDSTSRSNSFLHNRSTDPSYQNTLFTSYADECRARKKLLEIKIAQISRLVAITKKEIEIQEKLSPPVPEVFNIFDPIPSFDKIHMIIDCTNPLNSSSSLLLTPSCHEPIHPQFRPKNQQNSQNHNINRFNSDVGKLLCNVTKVSDEDAKNEIDIKPKPTESRKSIHMKMEVIERSARILKQYPQMYLTTEERDEVYSSKKKSFNESTLDYSYHPINKTVPLFWPSRPGDEKYRLSLEENDNLLAKIVDVIKSQSYENVSFRVVPLYKKKKRENYQKLKIPLNVSSTESSAQETEPDDFII